jgi:hypothetical protein
LAGRYLTAPVVGLATTPDGGGYWLATGQGTVAGFGDARDDGSAGPATDLSPIVGISASPTGSGYWLNAADGEVYPFGDATYRGSATTGTLDAPVVGGSGEPPPG